MFNYHKIIILCIAILYALPLCAQYLSQPFCEGVYMYLKAVGGKNECAKKGFNLQLVISNQNDNEVLIEDFSNTIFHQGDDQFRKKEENPFFWKLLTLNNSEVEDKIFSFPQTPQNTHQEEKVIIHDIYIAPQSYLIVHVNFYYSIFIRYPNGIYKLCLCHRKQDKKEEKCVAEMLIEMK